MASREREIKDLVKKAEQKDHLESVQPKRRRAFENDPDLARDCATLRGHRGSRGRFLHSGVCK
jgi:hypothetical protein